MIRRRLLPAAASLPAFGLAVVFVLGGLVAPDLHRASHAAEWAAERAAHAEAHAHGDAYGDAHGGADHADTPCPPAVSDLDCALCAGLSLAPPAAPVSLRPPDDRAAAPPPAWVSATHAAGATARPRGPPTA